MPKTNSISGVDLFGSPIPDWWDRFGSSVDELAGNFSDVTRFSNYQDAVDDLRKKKENYDKLTRLNEINKKLTGFDRSQVPMYREEEQPGINTDYWDALLRSGGEVPPEMQQYQTYVDSFKNEKDATYKNFDEWLKDLGQFDPFAEKYPTAFKPTKKQIPLTEQEKTDAYYKMAGLSPEDLQFYNEYKDKLNADKYNKELEQFMLERGPGLRSMGSRGDTYEQDLSKRVSSMLFNEPKPTEYKVAVDPKSGNLIYYNPQNPNDRRIVPYSEPKQKEPTTKGWDIFKDENGDPYWGERVFKNGKWQIEYRDELNQQEKDDYEADIMKRDKTGPYAPKGRSSRQSSNKGTDFSKWTTDKFKNIDVGDLDKMTAGELKNLSDYSQYLDKDVQDALITLRTEGSYRQSGANNDEDMVGGENDFEKQLYEGANEDEKQALDTVNKWFDDTVKAWGRSDLTADQWRDEIGQEQWTDLEFEIIKQLFKKLFGEDY